MQARLKPVFADVDEFLCLNPSSIEAKITPRTRAVMFVGIGGNSGRYAEVVQLCRRRGLVLILDAAHMAGTRLRGAHVGPEADVAVYSFQAVKNLPTADSGMICFRDAANDERVRKLTWLGINKDTYSRTAAQGSYKWMYDVEEVGFKYHGNSIMAAIGIVGLKYLDEDNAYRRSLAKQYRDLLSGKPGIDIVPVAEGCESSTHLLQIRVADRDAVMKRLNDGGVYPGVHYRDNTEYRMYSYARGDCPNASRASSEIISLPMHLSLSDTNVLTVATQVLESVL